MAEGQVPFDAAVADDAPVPDAERVAGGVIDLDRRTGHEAEGATQLLGGSSDDEPTKADVGVAAGHIAPAEADIPTRLDRD